MLQLHDMVVRRGDEAILQGVSVAFPEGEVHGLVGRNGAGKTTLLDTLAFMLSVESGHAILGDARLSSNDVAYVPSTLTFLPFVTVEEYLHAFNGSRSRRGLPASDMAAWCEAFDIPLDADAATLSAGTQQALALVAAISLARPVLLADELFATLDTDRQVVAAAALRGYARSGKHVIVTLHAADLIPLVCDRVHVLANGGIERELPPSPPPDLHSLLAAPGLGERATRAEQLASR